MCRAPAARTGSFRRAADGSPQYTADYATAGKGSGDGLGSQGPLTFSGDSRYLFAVIAGSNELSVFRFNGEALYLVDTVDSHGIRPVSVTEYLCLVYVVHAGENANAGAVSSFTVHDSNGVTPFGFNITDRGQIIVS